MVFPSATLPPAPRVTPGRVQSNSGSQRTSAERFSEDIVLKIHEYQAKEILRRYGVATPRGKVTESPDEAARICEELGGRCVVKAQIHAGGRGKGGGVKLAKSPEEAREIAGKILGMQLITHQTGPEGQTVKKVLVEEALDIASELYLSVTLDRARSLPILL